MNLSVFLPATTEVEPPPAGVANVPEQPAGLPPSIWLRLPVCHSPPSPLASAAGHRESRPPWQGFHVRVVGESIRDGSVPQFLPSHLFVDLWLMGC
jgi:hypothetical protein